jgi:hypothetical protein
MVKKNYPTIGVPLVDCMPSEGTISKWGFRDKILSISICFKTKYSRFFKNG